MLNSSPLTHAEFAGLMTDLGPFPNPPVMAVGVSGGPDSMALALLLADWGKDHGGRLIALTVDHGLRPESRAEAEQVGRWLGERGIDHRILSWDGTKPQTAVQAAARQARYKLMGEWCRHNRVSYLAVAHQLDDQAETFLLRLRQGSGLDGLAAMAVQRRDGDLRLIRPLLSVCRSRLTAFLDERGQPFVTDPSNRNPRYERVRLRRLIADLGLPVAAIAQTAEVLGRARRGMEALVDHAERLLASRHPWGFAVVDGRGLAELPTEVGMRLLSRLVRQIGGRAYPPRSERLERLLAAGAGTLAGCRVIPKPNGTLLICRENRDLEPSKPLVPGGRVVWDGRFVVLAAPDCPPGATVGALGADGWMQVRNIRPMTVSASVRAGLPAVWIGGKVVSLPDLPDKSLDNACIFRECDYFSIEALGYSRAASERG